MSTPSDEALALVLLENSWQCWVDIFDYYDSYVMVKIGEMLKESISNVKTKYTSYRISNKMEGQNRLVEVVV